MCYLLFGPATEDNIIKNLSTGAVLQAVRVLLCLDLLFTIPMLLAAGREILEESLMKTRFGRFGEHTRNVFRMLLLLIILGVTFGVVSADSSQAFGNVVTLVGAVACFSCGFIMPPLMHLANHGWLRAGILSFVFHLSITALGLLGMVTGVYFTVSSM